MNVRRAPDSVLLIENGRVDIDQLNELYRLIGWDDDNRRTEEETREMLRVSRYFVAADQGGKLVGFARVGGDPYIAQVLDVICHPEHRRQGIATACVAGVRRHLESARYVSVRLTSEAGLHGFYRRFGFVPSGDTCLRWAVQ